MFNILKMDLRRLLRSRFLYFLLGCLMVYLLSCVYLQKGYQNFDNIDIFRKYRPLNVGISFIVNGHIRTAQEFAEVYMPVVIPLFGGIIVTLFITSESKSGYLKNVYLIAKHRWYLIASKVIIFILISIVCIAFSYAILYVTGYKLIYGYIFAHDLSMLWQEIVWMMLMFTSFFSLVALIAEATRSRTITIIFIFLVVMNVYSNVLFQFLNSAIGVNTFLAEVINYFILGSPIIGMRMLITLRSNYGYFYTFVNAYPLIIACSSIISIIGYNALRVLLAYRRDI